MSHAKSVLALALLAACRPSGGENSALCGMTMLASATRIVEHLGQPHTALTTPPDELGQGTVPARVVGFGTTSAMSGLDEAGRAVVAYDGPGFPTTPGFGAALVDDSSEVFRGILIWDKDPPPDAYPTIGMVATANVTIPLIGVRIHWGSVNSERCPLFARPDSAQG